MRNSHGSDREKLREDSLEKYLRRGGEFAGMGGTASAQECTGLFAAPPRDAQDYENLRELHGMETPEKTGMHGKGR